MEKGIRKNITGRGVSVEIHDMRGNKVHTQSGYADQYGGFDGSFTLSEEPPLGVYRINVSGASYLGGQNFRVEEYKKPEFEVTVEPAKSHAKLGETVTAVIRADYFFGAPVTDATVKYKVFREEYRHTYYFPGYWDWLYGPGYGYGWYAYDWFPWWNTLRCCWAPPYWWWGWYGSAAPTPVRELVLQGNSRISADGTLEVDIETAAALRDHPDRDHRYVVEAEVRDASRRVIIGAGAVTVTRQAYYAFVQSDKGYYRPGEEMVFNLRCLTPGNAPIETEGVVTVSRVVFGGPDNARIEETELERFKVTTDKRGIATFRMRHERSDQLKIRFEAPDEWGGTVEGFGLVWVCGRDFDGKLYRFNDLELITDKRTYEPGEVCHLMINTKKAGSTVLFSDEVDNNHLLSWRFLHIEGRHTVVGRRHPHQERPPAQLLHRGADRVRHARAPADQEDLRAARGGHDRRHGGDGQARVRARREGQGHGRGPHARGRAGAGAGLPQRIRQVGALHPARVHARHQGVLPRPRAQPLAADEDQPRRAVQRPGVRGPTLLRLPHAAGVVGHLGAPDPQLGTGRVQGPGPPGGRHHGAVR